LLIVALVAGTALWQVVESRRTFREQILSDGKVAAGIASAVVRAELSGHLRLVEGVAGRQDLATLVVDENWQVASVFLKGILDVDPDLGSAALFDARGRLWARAPSDPSVVGKGFSFRDDFRGAFRTGRPYVSEVFLQSGAPRAVVVAFADVVRNPAGKVVGLLQATLPVARLDLLAGGIEVPDGGSIRLFDGAGHALTTTGEGLGRSYASQPVVSRPLAGAAGAGELAVPGLPGTRLAAYAPVPGVGWAVVVEHPREAAYRSLGALTTRLAGIGTLVTLVVFAGFLLFNHLLRRLARERNRSRAILASIADGVVTTDPQGRIVSINAAMEDLAGWREPEVRGRVFAETYRVFGPSGKPLHPEEQFLAKAIVAREVIASRGFDLTLLTRDDHRVPIGIAASPILEGGRLLGGVAVLRNLSHEHEVDRLKSSLISTVSHELRTPLTMIRGFSELLMTRDLGTEKSREAATQINVSADRLSRLIDDLLSVSRIDSGHLAARPAPLSLERLVREVVAGFSRQGDRPFTLTIAEGMPEVLADRDMVVQVLTNLVSNAVKYSPATTPVDVSVRANGNGVQVSVRDHGVGMSEQDATRLFEKFFRGEGPEVRLAGGTGLGLYITKNLVEMQGGRIWVRTRPGEGSVFTFSLPRAAEIGGNSA
jgi:PAS domain S-box-containing protein